MKKRLLLLLVLTGVMIVVSSSVFAEETHPASYLWVNNGYTADEELEYTFAITRYSGQWVIELNIRNNYDESVVLSTPNIVLEFSQTYHTLTSAEYIASYVVTGGGFIVDYDYHYVTWPGMYTITVLLEDSVFNVGDSQNYTVTVNLDSDVYRGDDLDSINSSITFPSLVYESDPIYEASVTANQIAVKEETIHQAETVWYQNNETAIQNVGLENFNFSSGTTGGLQVMQQQFSNIWNAIGDLNLIYVFTLLMSLATFILRHWPRTRQSETITDTVTHTTNLNTGEESAFLTTRKTFRR